MYIKTCQIIVSASTAFDTMTNIPHTKNKNVLTTRAQNKELYNKKKILFKITICFRSYIKCTTQYFIISKTILTILSYFEFNLQSKSISKQQVSVIFQRQ